MTNTNESGRSMVEMLGVLAIIGVLSVMGIAGYTQAMKKYKTNEAAAEISMGAMLCATGQGIGGYSGTYVTGMACEASTAGGPTDRLKWTSIDSGVDMDNLKAMLKNNSISQSNGNYKIS